VITKGRDVLKIVNVTKLARETDEVIKMLENHKEITIIRNGVPVMVVKKPKAQI